MSDQRKIQNIACIGEVMIELVMQDETRADLNIAGDTYNTAVYLARLLERSETAVSYVTALGTDRFSDRILRHMQSAGLSADCVERRPDRTVGLYAIDTDDAGERSFTYWRSASAARTLFDAPAQIGLDVLLQFDLVYLSGITLAILPDETRSKLLSALENFRARGGRVAYDSNHRPRLWESAEVARIVNDRMWAHCDIALPSIDDEQCIFDEASETDTLERLRSYGIECGAVKRGQRGPVPITHTETQLSFPPAAKVVDTTAAGDSFNAGFLAEIAGGASQSDAMQMGHSIASRVVQKRGAIVAL